MKIDTFITGIESIGGDFYTGVPDSQLQPLCDFLFDKYSISSNHIIAANEGNCTALAAGYYFSTGKTPVVYMQNSGLGNIINPVASLMHNKVYNIPCIFIIGWRGEPGIIDEPQHVFQGEITTKLLDDIEIPYMIIRSDTTNIELEKKSNEFKTILDDGKNVAFIICKNALTTEKNVVYKNQYSIEREEAIRHIIAVADKDIIISTTGKTSRELYELREQNGQSHKYDFLTVGSMGHSSSIALGVALNKPSNKVWCIDGDGAALMHMGAMATIGSIRPKNLIHIVNNNEAHETVGGMPTVSNNINFVDIALACGYLNAVSVDNIIDLDKVLYDAKKADELTFIEVKSAIGSRKDLGRPTTTPKDNKVKFMEYLKEIDL